MSNDKNLMKTPIRLSLLGRLGGGIDHVDQAAVWQGLKRLGAYLS